ncbi:unnamed protein product, partial [Durusdinium trenchii]
MTWSTDSRRNRKTLRGGGDGRLLQKRLWALRHALEAADAEQRRQAIEKRLSPQLRQELLWLMEKVPSSREPRGVPKMRSQDPSRVRASLWTVRTSKGRYHAVEVQQFRTLVRFVHGLITFLLVFHWSLVLAIKQFFLMPRS